MDPAKLKVVELRAELQARGLDTKGIKSILVDRLSRALEEEGAAIRDQALGLSSPKIVREEQYVESIPDEVVHIPESPVQASEPEEQPVQEPIQSIPEEEPVVIPAVIETPTIETPADDSEPSFADQEVSNASSSLNESALIDQVEPVQSTDQPEREVSPLSDEQKEEEEDDEEMKLEPESMTVDQEESQEVEKREKEEVKAEAPVVEEEPKADEKAEEESKVGEVAEKMDSSQKTDEVKKEDEESRKRKRSRSPSSTSSRQRSRSHQPAATKEDFVSVEDEPEIDPEKVILSWFDSDLQLKVSPTDFCEARPISDAALGLVWAGARATQGVTSGRVFYEVKLVQKNSRVNFPDEKNLFNLRCGWSTKKTDLQLGDAAFSYGFDGTGKKVTGNEFQDYGTAFGIDDVVGVYLDLDSEPCNIQYTVNGDSLGTAFEFNKSDLDGEALFPHIISKNVAFKVNFGQLEDNLLKELVVKVPEVVVPVKEKKEEPKNEEVESEEKEKEPQAEKPEENVEVAEEAKPEEENKVEADEAPKEETPMEEDAKAEEETPKQDDAAKKNNDDETKEVVEEEELAKEPEPVKEINRENLPDYEFIGRVAKENLVAGPVRPESRKECEVVLMIGLPGAGKTHWALKYVSENPEKRYDILGDSALIGRMKIDGLQSKVDVGGRRQRLSELCTRGLAALQDIAQKRRRNYILDQTNVFVSAQRRKMKGFGDFRRLAVVVVPDADEYAKRLESGKSEAESGGDNSKDLSETEVNEMKANFTLPTPDLGWFDEIRYSDLENEAAMKVVDEYNSAGRKALPPPPKKRPAYEYRNNNNDRRRRDFDNRDNRYSRWGGSDRRIGGSGGGGGGMPYENRDRWNGPPGGHPGGGYRQPQREYGSGGFDRRAGGDRWAGGGGGGGGSGQWVNSNRRGYNERDYRSGGGGGGGGRSDYNRDYRSGPPAAQRDYQQQHNHHHNRDSSNNRRRSDGREDFRERSRDNHGAGAGKRHESMDHRRGGSSGSSRDYHHNKRDNSSSSGGASKNYDSNKTVGDMTANNGSAAGSWNNWAHQPQQQWGVAAGNNWQVDQQGWGQQQAWTGHQMTGMAQQSWQGWNAAPQMQTAAATTAAAGQWKSYGASGTQQSTTDAVANQWDNQWTGF